MRNRREFLTGASSVAVTLAALGWARPARAAACPICKTTSLLLPLSGTFFHPRDPCVQAGENVALAGDVHVVTKVGQGFVVDLHLNMAGVDGTGQTSGSLYIGTGSNKFIGIQFPSEPCAPNPIRANFTLETTNGCASVPLPLTAQLCFAADGTLLPESTIVVGGVG
jgi:hypothetical protein